MSAALCAALTGRAADVPPTAEAPREAEHARLAAHGLLIGLARAGERLVAVGDRGIIVLSDDQGRSWTQADTVPTQALLTGVCFFDAQHGIAVGHDEVILVTADAGVSWQRTHYAPEAQQPLLDVWCGSGGHAIAVGAYSAYFNSTDRGASWSAVRFDPKPAPRAPAAARAAAPRAGAAASAEGANGADDGKLGGYHLNRIVGASDTRLYIAGEAGHLYRSDDAGASWQELSSPYHGSFFGALPLTDDSLLVFGLRGNMFRSADAGASWQKIETGVVALLSGGTRFDTAGAVVAGLAGVVLVSRDGGHTFSLEQQPDYTGLAAVLSVGDDRLAVTGEEGARVISLSHAAPGATGAPGGR